MRRYSRCTWRWRLIGGLRKAEVARLAAWWQAGGYYFRLLQVTSQAFMRQSKIKEIRRRKDAYSFLPVDWIFFCKRQSSFMTASVRVKALYLWFDRRIHHLQERYQADAAISELPEEPGFLRSVDKAQAFVTDLGGRNWYTQGQSPALSPATTIYRRVLS